MLITWTKETEDRYTATWQGSALLLKYFNRCWRVVVRHLADQHVCCPPNRWHSLDAAMQDVDVKALRALMLYARPVAHQKPLPSRSVALAAVKQHLATRGRTQPNQKAVVDAVRKQGLPVLEIHKHVMTFVKHTNSGGLKPESEDRRHSLRASLRGPKEYRGVRKP